MDQYLGRSLRFETATGKIEGRLKEIKMEEGKLVVEENSVSNKIKEISIIEIIQLELVMDPLDQITTGG